MKKLILIILLSCCMIMFFSVAVSATDYTFKGCGHSSNYDVSVMSKQLVENIIKSECGTLDNIYYLASWKEDFSGRPYSILIWLLFDIEVKGLKGNVAYVLNDGGMRVNRNWGVLYNNNFSEIFVEPGYTSCYVETSSNPFQYGFTDHSQEMYLCTNIPIFKTVEGKDEYFNTGSTADMIGAEPQYDTSIPKVENAYVSYKIKNTSGDTDFFLNFDFPDTAENMTAKCYWQLKGDFYNNYFLFSDKNPNGKKLDTTIMELVDIPYQANSVNYLISYDFISKYIIDNYGSSGLGGFVTWSDSFKLTELIFYIQIEDDSRKGDIVKVTFDCQNMTSKLSELGVNHVANGSSGTVDNGGDISSADSSNTVDNRDFKDYSDISESSIMDYIKSGFGLVGDDGLIPLLGSVFGFLPRPIIIIMTSTFAIISVVIIAKFLRG